MNPVDPQPRYTGRVADCDAADAHRDARACFSERVAALTEPQILSLGRIHRKRLGMDRSIDLRRTAEHEAGPARRCLKAGENTAAARFLDREQELGIDYHSSSPGDRKVLLAHAYEAVQRAGMGRSGRCLPR